MRAFSKTSVELRVKNILNYKKPALWVFVVALIAVMGIGGFLLANGETKSIDINLAWAHNLTVNNVKLIETVISPSDRDRQYKNIQLQDFETIVKIINSSNGKKVEKPDELGDTINEFHDYYLFEINGDCYMQDGKDGFNTKIDTELYHDFVRLI